ncbi:MAG TPA: hypothetical protein VGD13_09480, partial [Xanthobacteraceae bacterium]
HEADHREAQEGDFTRAVSCRSRGAKARQRHAYLLKPFRPDELVSLAIEVMQKMEVKCPPIRA